MMHDNIITQYKLLIYRSAITQKNVTLCEYAVIPMINNKTEY